MTGIKISQLSAESSVDPADVFPVVSASDGSTKKVTASTLHSFFGGGVRVAGSGAVTLASNDSTVILTDSSGSSLALNLPAGVDGKVFNIAVSAATRNAATNYSLVPNGADQVDTAVPANLTQSAIIVFASGTWYIVNM